MSAVIAIIAGGFLVDAVKNNAGNWGANLLEGLLGAFESTLWRVGIFGYNENLIDQSRHNNGVGNAVTWSAIEDDNVELAFEFLNKAAILLGA